MTSQIIKENHYRFLQESRMLSGKFDEPDDYEQRAFNEFMHAPTLSMAALQKLAEAFVHDPQGVTIFPERLHMLSKLLTDLNLGLATLHSELKSVMIRDREAIRAQQHAWLAYTLHRALHELQPFNGGLDISPIGVNGLVGRAAWLWVMGGEIEGTFLTTWYQQSLRFGGTAEIEKEADHANQKER